MPEERSTHTEEQEKTQRLWRPTNRQALWAIGLVVALVTLALLIVQLYPGLWENVSREPVAMLKGRLATLIGIGVALTVLIVLLTIGGASLRWTGFADKTLWEWLQLLGALAIPVVLAIAGFWFTSQQELSARKVEEQRAQDAALQAYLDQMSTLLLADEGLRESKEGSEVRTLARARTITVLGRLDPSRKRAVMLFLYEADLVQGSDGTAPIFPLWNANLSDTNLHGWPLMGADLTDADLSDAELRGADLSQADLSQADLSQADLSGAHLSDTDLEYANLSDANLSGADLSDASLKGARSVTNAQLAEARSLKGATMPDSTLFSDEFEPPLSVRLSDGWDIAEVQKPDSISIYGPEGGQLNFTSPLHVFDPSNPSEPKKLPAPENIDEWVSWLQSHPNLATSKPVQASVGDASGKSIDVTVTSTPENYPKDLCSGQPCVPLHPLSDENRTLVYEGYKDRFVIVDVGGETVLIDVGTQADRFDEFLPKAQKVLDSVEWKGG